LSSSNYIRWNDECSRILAEIYTVRNESFTKESVVFINILHY